MKQVFPDKEHFGRIFYNMVTWRLNTVIAEFFSLNPSTTGTNVRTWDTTDFNRSWD